MVLNFWATWCPYCVMELPELQALHEELQERGDAVILLLDQIDGEWETVESGTAYLAEQGITIPNLMDYGLVAMESSRFLACPPRWSSMPRVSLRLRHRDGDQGHGAQDDRGAK